MAITYGMSVKEFWEDDPDLFWAYRFSYFSRMKVEQELYNQQAWLQGGYICEAVHVAIANSFSNEKVEYSKKPYDLKTTNKEEIIKNKANELVDRLRNRVAEVKIIKGENDNSTTIQGDSRTVK